MFVEKYLLRKITYIKLTLLEGHVIKKTMRMEIKKNMAKSGQNKVITWQEVEKHKTRDSRWLVIEGNVYDVTEWQGKHPGGARILGHFGGQDATVRIIMGFV